MKIIAVALRFLAAGLFRAVTLPKALGSQKGFGLVHVMMAAVVLSGIILALNAFLNRTIKEDVLANTANGRLLAYKATSEFASSPDVILTSAFASGNAALARCLFSNYPICTATNPSNPQLIKLYAPMSTAQHFVPVTGRHPPSDTDGNYTQRGLRLNCTPSATCPFKSLAYFYAVCPNNAVTCPVSRQIVIIPKIRIHTVASQKVVKLENYPTPSLLATNPNFGKVVLETNEILRNSIIECPDGAFMSGVDSSGGLQCRCQNGYKQTGTMIGTGWPICQAIANCPVGQVMTGVKANGDAYCRTPPTASYNCVPMPTPSNTFLHCPNENWRMNSVQISDECVIDTNDEMHCNFTSITCCERI